MEKHVEDAAQFIDRTTKSDRRREAKNTLAEIAVRERAAVRSSRPLVREVLWMQARRARAEHAVKMQHDAWQKKTEKKTLDASCTSMAVSQRAEVRGENYRDTSQKFVWIPRKRLTNRRRGF